MPLATPQRSARSYGEMVELAPALPKQGRQTGQL